MSDFPILAPRPVRLTTASIFAARSHSAHAQLSSPGRIVSAPHDMRACTTASDMDSATRLSPIASPVFEIDRSSTSPRLPSEAVEEFLSILRPSAHSFSSLQVHHPSPSYGRSSILAPSASFGSGLGGYCSTLFALDETHRDETTEGDGEGDSLSAEISRLATQPVRWFAHNALSSPVSRLNTRNPFHRHPSYSTPPRTPSAAPAGPSCRVSSPANIPLPPSPIPVV